MYKKILVPLDGSPMAERILPYTAAVGKAFQIPVELLHVVDPDTFQAFVDPEHSRYLDTIESDLKQRGANYLARIAGTFPSSMAAECHVHVGHPAEQIVEKAAEDAATLVAMSTHGYSKFQRLFLGSVADKVLHACTNPLLLVRAKEDDGPKSNEVIIDRLLVPLDGSSLAENALPHVIALGSVMDLKIVLFRVYSLMPSFYVMEGYPPDVERPARDRMREETELYLKNKSEELRSHGLKDVSYVMVEGDAAKEITEMAQQMPKNLVAMCTHGRSGVGRWVLGSVTDRVVRQSGDAVLVLRAASTMG